MYVYKNKSTILQGIFDVCLCFISSKRTWTFYQYIYIINTRWKVTYLKVLPLLCIQIDKVNIWWEVTYTRVHSLLCYNYVIMEVII